MELIDLVKEIGIVKMIKSYVRDLEVADKYKKTLNRINNLNYTVLSNENISCMITDIFVVGEDNSIKRSLCKNTYMYSDNTLYINKTILYENIIEVAIIISDTHPIKPKSLFLVAYE